MFDRTSHGLVLSDRSQHYAHALTEVFSRLEDETDRFIGVRKQSVLTVRAYTSFLVGILIPALPDFQLHHPNIRVRLISAADRADLDREQVDVRIRYGRGHWTNYESVLLFRDEITPVCSPSILPPASRPYPIEILREQTLLHSELRKDDWPEWLVLAGGVETVQQDNLYFDELSVTYQAAIAGLGIAIANRAYLRDELSSGALFEPFDMTLKRDFGYYLSYPPERRDVRQITVFRDWLASRFEDRAG